MTDNLETLVHQLVRRSIYSVADMEAKFYRALRIVERAAKQSCCLCDDNCLTCDAKDLLKELQI